MKGLLLLGLLPFAAGALAQPIDQPQPYRPARASSARTDFANADAVKVAPHSNHVVAELSGAGRIVHWWFTFATAEENYLRTTWLKVYWDGAAEPAVEAPIGHFHALSHGTVRPVNSAFITVEARPQLTHNLKNPNVAGFNCSFPMPFARGAKIVIENRSPTPITALYYQIDWQQWSAAPSPLRFHARHHETAPEPYPGDAPGRADARNTRLADNHLILATEGEGHFVGVVLGVDAAGRGWWEGDEMIWIDGEKAPSILGTGTEDYFGGAWGFRQEYNTPYHGVSYLEKVPERSDWQAGRFTAYRFHEKDPVPFRRSFRMSIERGHNNHRRDSTYSSVAFWYQR
ncbi:MAG: DUF2961 domain-containing protein [Verrucomicrobia bacterium]|nr:DUF2961 domain-containing protein [Verrucomicrobiota bacterium]